MDSVDLIRKIKLARKYILNQEYEQAYNETYLPPEIEETNSLPVEAGVMQKIAIDEIQIRINETKYFVEMFRDIKDQTIKHLLYAKVSERIKDLEKMRD